MPFQSEKQRRLCWYLYNQSIKKGEKQKWDCKEWQKETTKNINNALQLRFLSSNPNDLYKSITATAEESKKESKKDNVETKAENTFNQIIEAKKKAKKMKADLLD